MGFVISFPSRSTTVIFVGFTFTTLTFNALPFVLLSLATPTSSSALSV